LAKLKIHDRADEFRVELVGNLAGDAVAEVFSTWKAALSESVTRRFTVDISRLTGWDNAGRRLLCKMHAHGTQFSAGTPASLVFLSEISTPSRRRGALLTEGAEQAVKERTTKMPIRTHAVAVGH